MMHCMNILEPWRGILPFLKVRYSSLQRHFHMLSIPRPASVFSYEEDVFSYEEDGVLSPHR